MSLPTWYEAAINKALNRDDFDCGQADLNEYLQKHARKNHERGGAKTFLAIECDTQAILGYYSLSPASVKYSRVPEGMKRGLGHYEVAGFRLARLAVAVRLQKWGLGGQLLLSAARRCLLASAEVGGTVLVIDAKNERVAGWYASYGAMPLLDAPLILVLSLATMSAALQEAAKP